MKINIQWMSFSTNKVFLLSICLLFWNAVQARCDFVNLYSVGNSLTVDLRANSGLEVLSSGQSNPVLHDYHVKCGSSLTGILATPETFCVPSLRWGQLNQAFATNAPTRFNAVTLQPFYGNTIRGEVNAANSLIGMIRANPLNSDTRIMVYATWAMQSDGPFLSRWNQTGLTLDSPFVPSAQSYQLFMNELRLTVPSAEIIPVGHVMAEIAQRLAVNPNAIPGFGSTSDFYRDDIHASNATSYIAGVTAFATIYNKSPVGLGTSGVYELNGYGTSLSPEGRAAVQSITWEVTQGFTAVPEPTSIALLATVIVISGLGQFFLRTSQRLKTHAKSPDMVGHSKVPCQIT